MHAGRHHLLPGLQAGGHHHGIAIGASHGDGLHLYRHRGSVQQPHCGAPLLLHHGRQRQPRDAFCSWQFGQHADGLAQLQGRAAHIGLHEEGARCRVGSSRHFTHGGWQQCRAAPATHLQRARFAQQRAHRCGTVLGHRKHGVTGAVVGQAQHRRAGSQHCSHFGLRGGDHAGRRGHQRRIARLIALHTGLRLRLIELGFLRLQRCVATLQFEAADEALRTQFLVALELSRSQVILRLRGAGGGQRSFLPQLQIGGIQLG